MDKNKTRNSNLELLRIISMILIIAHHYSVHGFTINTLNISFNKCIIDILSLGGKIGVNCFILISGYFMINSKFTIKKLWKIIGEVLFYSYGIFILFLTIFEPINNINTQSLLLSILPISSSAYWFITCYIVLMIISPYINIFIKNLTKTELRNFICLMIFLWSIIYAIFPKASLCYDNLGWFLILYCISSYIKLYVHFDNKKIKINKIILFTFIILLILLSIAFNLVGKLPDIVYAFGYTTYFNNQNSILIVIISVSLFVYFCTKKITYNKFINEIAKYTLGVYLIHDNILLRPYLWRKILKNPLYYSSNLLVIHAIISIIFVYIICTIIDWIRSNLIEPLWLKLFEILEKKTQKN